MKKVDTITCHRVYNYGATLQAYALQQYLKSVGYESEIIDFIPWYHNRYSFWKVNKGSTHYNLIKNNIFLRLIYGIKFNLPIILREYKRKKAFERFDSKYLNISNKTYSGIENLKNNPPEADAYICGSDQIWNSYATQGIEKAYYLDFGSEKVFRMSYAPSFGGNQLQSSDNIREIKSLLRNINLISVREKSGLSILNDLNIPDVTQVLDPVFLLDESTWRTLAKEAKLSKIPSRYILLYNFRKNNEIRNFVKVIQNKLNIPILSIHAYDDIEYADMKIRNAGPLEFLWLISNAEVVISDSFHATVFATIFTKEFYTFSLEGQNNTARMKDFLEIINVKDRLNVNRPSSKMIDYKEVKKNLNPRIEQSKSFLSMIQENIGI